MVSFLFVYAFLWTDISKKKKSWNIPKFYKNVTPLNLSLGEIKKLNYHNIQVWKYVPEVDRQNSRFFAHIYMLVDLKRTVFVIDLMPRSRMHVRTCTCEQCIKMSTGLRRLVNKLPEGQSRNIQCRFYLLWNNKYVLQIEWHTYWRAAVIVLFKIFYVERVIFLIKTTLFLKRPVNFKRIRNNDL